MNHVRKLLDKLSRSAQQNQTQQPQNDVGLYDMILSGWFNQETGELVEGFPIGPDDTVMDIGCGTGGFTLFSGRQGAEIYVVDVDESKLDIAVQRLKETAAKSIHKMVSDANPLLIADQTLTRVIAMEVIEHVDDPLAFLKELVRVGKPGALYLLTVPDAISEHTQKGIAPDIMFQKPNHINIFERDEFLALVENAGLTIERNFTYGFYRAVWWFFFWASAQPELAPPWQPLLQQWDETWRTLLAQPQGPQIKNALDSVFGKSQVIVARKPSA